MTVPNRALAFILQRHAPIRQARKKAGRQYYHREVITLEKNLAKSAQATNAAAGYGPDNPEPMAFKETGIPVDKDALHAAGEYIRESNTTPAVNPSPELINRTEP